ncbi:MAG: zinc metallopeptidase [Planctomycetes bacterium]|nr:zinc metallopeptidase [Planctomycetota bacterium]
MIVGPFFLLAMLASFFVKQSFARWSQQGTRRRMTGADVARQYLADAGLPGVQVEEVPGRLSDHYDPRTQIVRLSSEVYRSDSIAAVAVAAHEVGHAVQHAHGYAPLALRSLAVPAATIGSNLSILAIVAGVGLVLQPLVWVGIVLFSAVVAFQLITLPVEFNASSRAKAYLIERGLVSDQEASGVRSVLTAAALTYVAAALTSIATLVYYLGFLRSDD